MAAMASSCGTLGRGSSSDSWISPASHRLWAAAWWAVRFYQKHGFTLVTPQEKDRLLRTYWTITDRQVETSVVLGDARWFADNS